MALTARHCLISGRVQGVGFRYHVCRKADDLNLCGFVRNLPDGKVEIWIQGPDETIEKMLADLRIGPPWAQVDHIEAKEVIPSDQWIRFSILR